MISPILPIRVAQAVLSIIELGLAAYVASAFNRFAAGDSPSSLNFLIFCSIWTWLALAYLLVVPQFLPKFHNQYAVLGVEAVTMIFWFAGFIAWAAALGDIGACDNNSYCGSAKGAAAFGAFMWLLFVASLVLICRAVWMQRKNGGAGGGLSEAPHPAAAFSGGAGSVSGGGQYDVEQQHNQTTGFNPSSTPAPYDPPHSAQGHVHPQFAGTNEYAPQQQQQQQYGYDQHNPTTMPQAGGYGGSDYSTR